MRILLSVLFLLTLSFSVKGTDDWFTGVLDENGILVLNPPGQIMNPYSGSFPMVTPNYPSPAPNNFRRLWRWVTADEKNSAIKVICYDLRLPEGSCSENSFIIEDGEKNNEYCGNVGPFTFISETNNIRGVLNNGAKGESYVNCTAEAIFIGEYREEITTPKPRLPSYLTDESEEVDSEEHGGPPGDKATTCPCGWANKQGFSRIVNGTDTLPNEFPFIAALVEKDSLWQFCGSTIITAWHAITAAHCTIGWREKPRMAIVVGEHDLTDDANSGPSQVIDVANIVEHDGYAPGKYRDDLSLLILAKEIIFSPQVGPACLPTRQYDLAKKYVKIIGWGGLYWRGPGAEILQKVDVRVVDIAECNYVYSAYVSKTEPTQICTYAKRKGSCQGDSGGPVVYLDPETNRYTLIGAVSFGRVCADNSPSVHTDIAYYMDWITHFVSVSKPNAQMCFKKE